MSSTPKIDKLAQLKEAPAGIAQLEKLLEILRGADGCPWDKKQTHTSLKPYLLEETYEVLTAIDHGEYSQLKKELGDLLLQITFHCQLAKEQAQFSLTDVAQAEVEKMVDRHPHVFGNEHKATAEEVTIAWQKRKQQAEKQTSIAQDIAKSMPALARAQLISQRAASLGFDWQTVTDVWTKVEEEMAELAEQLVQQADTSLVQKQLAEELGDVLFTLVNLARKLGFEAEFLMQQATEKFVGRFDHILQESSVKQLPDTPSAWETAWLKAKLK